MKIAWKLFKPHGKYAYEGISDIPDSTNLWDDNVLQLLDDNQNEVTAGTIVRRGYYCVIELVEGTCSDPDKFFTALCLAREDA